MRCARLPALLAISGLLAGCATAPARGPIADEEVAACARFQGGMTVLLLRAAEVDAVLGAGEAGRAAAQELARGLDEARASVTRFLGREPPALEVRLTLDPSPGREAFDITHGRVMTSPRRVVVPCSAIAEEAPGALLERLRGTVAHEVAEATVIELAPVLDPYLRWMHDGIAVLSEYLVETGVSAAAGSRKLERTLRDLRARPRDVEWADLTRWRQAAPWIVHSDTLTWKQERIPLDDTKAALAIIRKERWLPVEGPPDPGRVALIESLAGFVADAWRKESMGVSDREADSHRPAHEVFFYEASFAVWLEAERRRPGTLARALEGVVAEARRTPILASDQVAAMISEAFGEDVQPLLHRYPLARAERVVEEELARLRDR